MGNYNAKGGTGSKGTTKGNKQLGQPKDLHLYDIPEYVLQARLGNGILKSVQCVNDQGLVTVKVFLLNDDEILLTKYAARLKELQERITMEHHPNLVVLQKVEQTDKVAVVVGIVVCRWLSLFLSCRFRCHRRQNLLHRPCQP